MKSPEQLNTPDEGEQSQPKILEEPEIKTYSKAEAEDQGKKDSKEIQETRSFVEKEMDKNNGWRAERKPRNEWREERQITTEGPVDSIKKWLKSLTPAEKLKRKENEQLGNELLADRRELPETTFEYKIGAGVEGRVGKNLGILAKGFNECSALVFQTEDSVSVLHISPNTMKDPSDGGDIVRDEKVHGHIKSALQGLLESNPGARSTNGDADLTQQQLEVLQKMVDSGKLKSTMISGEDQIVPHAIAVDMADIGKALGLPHIKTDIHYVGNRVGEGYAVYANPKKLYCLGSNNVVMKQGKNFPPTMYNFKKK